jgi:hypothetical protein
MQNVAFAIPVIYPLRHNYPNDLMKNLSCGNSIYQPNVFKTYCFGSDVKQHGAITYGIVVCVFDWM